jgi:hypothetical protein
MKSIVLWNTMGCRVVELTDLSDRSSATIFRVRELKLVVKGHVLRPTLVSCSVYTFTRKMEAACFVETLISSFRNIP